MRKFTTVFAGNNYPVFVAETLTDYWDCRKWLDESQPDTVFGLDVETTGVDQFDPEFSVRMVQISDGNATWLLPASNPDEPFVAKEVRSLLEASTLRVATHTQFDPLSVRVFFGANLGQRVVDTFLIASLIKPAEEEERDLKTLATEYLNGPELKSAADQLHARFKDLALEQGNKLMARSPKKLIGWGFANIPLDDPLFEHYAALDALAVAQLAPALVGMLSSSRNLIGIEMWLASLVADMRMNGMQADEAYIKSALSNLEAEIQIAEETICRITGLDSPRSPKRVDWLLSKGVTFDPKAVTDKGKPSLSKDFLPPLVAKYSDTPEVGEVLLAINEIAERSNLATNLNNFLSYMDIEGRVHPEIKTLKARTARMSVVSPAMQTLSKTDPRLRGSFIADPGMSLVSVDFSQVELRVAAALSGDPVLAEPILAGEDIHSDTARRIWGPDFTPEQRQLAKIVNFGSVYGGGAKTLSRQTGISIPEAQEVVTMWRSTYPVLSEFANTLAQRNSVKTPTGRVLPVDHDRRYAALNYMVQSTSRDLLVIAVLRIIHYLGVPSSAFWMLVHDEVVLQVPTDLAETVAEEVQEVMATTLYGIPIVAEAKVLGHRWAMEE